MPTTPSSVKSFVRRVLSTPLLRIHLSVWLLTVQVLRVWTAYLTGTSAIATSKEDYVAAARILGKYEEQIKTFKMKSGFIDKDVIGEEKLSELSKLPSREVLLATVLSAFNAPIAAFARAVQAIVDKSGEAPAEEAAEEAPAAETAAPAEAEAPAAE